MKWHFYTDGQMGYWSTNPPCSTKDSYVAYIISDQRPTEPPWRQVA